ncbi:hypothetical protein HYPSUDRAFT_45882 [Hypholoma sublateritium FD-334 SS-4]|uniref:Protein PBN1 n=1 Tax=Hypholoma sublateritium (strain FD-334 SS-4) TaxID=945553 RepID=A0A0D2NFW6_HYPSF|nr:hypothetical protein HYPSUDRAFT_45882 [Hypholoma sublateritium FD-334 SS-4]
MSYLNSTLLPQRGAHPVSTSIIHLVGTLQLYGACTLHLLYTLPPLLFVDTHELAQRDASYAFEHWGTRDLERPVHALPNELSELLLTVRLPEAGADIDVPETVVQVEVPMHLRYGAPKRSGVAQTKPYLPLEVEWPQAFLRCRTSIPNHPPSSLSLSEHVSSALPSIHESILLAIPPHSSFSAAPWSPLVIPLGNPQDLSVVEPLTALTILATFFWLLRVSCKVAHRLNSAVKRPKTV